MVSISRRGLTRWALALALGAWFAAAPAAFAADAIEVSLDRIEAQVGEPLTVTVKVNGRLAGALKLPDTPDWVVARGPSQRSVTNIVNFQVQSYTEYTWNLVARRPGTFRFGPVTGIVDGKAATSAEYPFPITIGGQKEDDSRKPDVFVEASAEPAVAYPGQQVMYTLRIYRAVQVTNYRYGPPNFDGFLEEPMDESSQSESVTQIGGRQYVVKEVRHALFPTRAGSLEIGQATVIAEVITERPGRRRRGDPFDVFFDSPFGARPEQRELIAPPVAVQVKPLPPGAPDGFYGLVGDFDIRWQISNRELAQGASSTLTIDIEGTGNVRDIAVPQLALDGFKVYEDSPALQLSFDARTRRLKGKKQFKLALIPLEPGQKTLPPAQISFFDPVAREYKTARTRPLPLVVTPGSGEDASTAVTAPRQPESGRSVEVVGEDILPLMTITAPRGERIFGPGNPLALGLFFAPPLAYLLLALVLRWRARDAANPAARRRRRALPEALAVVDSARAAIATDPREAFRQLDRAVNGFIADRLNLAGRALTPDEARRQVASAGASEALQARLHGLLQAIEQAQYMPASTAGDAAAARCEEAKGVLKALDKEMA